MCKCKEILELQKKVYRDFSLDEKQQASIVSDGCFVSFERLG